MLRSMVMTATAAVTALALWSTAAAQVGEGRAVIVVKAPKDALITLDTVPTKQTGESRKFVTPPLQPGQHHYVLRATWNENGQVKTVTRKVVVQAGQQVDLDLKAEPIAAPVAKAKTQMPPVAQAKSGTNTPPPVAQGKQPKVRNFLFTYNATVTDLPPGKTARVWLPVPPSNEFQDVDIVDMKGIPETAPIQREKLYGNKILSFDAKADAEGKIPVTIIYKVSRREVVGPAKGESDTAQIARFLQADALAPLDGKQLDLIKGKSMPIDDLAMGKLLYDVVDDHVKYSKDGKGWGRGDVAWVCDSKYGNCTDFHSLFIALARSQRIPAKFEMGFPLPAKHGEGEFGGYHCWAWFKPKTKGWIGVDISEADKDPKMKEYYFGNLTEDRVQFTTGRDIDLVPKQDGPPLNYFIYPYAEVDGKPYDKVTRKFAYRDQ